MKRFLPAILTLMALFCMSACKNQNNNKKSVVGAIELNEQLLTMDLNTFINYYFRNDGITAPAPVASLLKEYGLGRIGSFQGGADYEEAVFTKDCQYDSQSRQFTGWSNDSQAISVSTDGTGSHSFSHYIASTDDKDAIFKQLTEAGFIGSTLGENKYHHENKYLGIDTQLEGGAWVMRAIVRGDADYPFIKAVGPHFYEEKMSNPSKLEADFKGKRIKIRGTVVRTPSGERQLRLPG